MYDFSAELDDLDQMTEEDRVAWQKQRHCWPHDWPNHHKPGYESCTKCGYIGIRELTKDDMTEEEWQNLISQFLSWKPTSEEMLVAPIFGLTEAAELSDE